MWRRGGRGRISDLGRVGSLWGARRGRSMLGDTRRCSGGFCRARAAAGGYGKNRSESIVGGRNKFSTAGTAIVSGDGGSCTSDESPRRSREVVNPHMWLVCAKKVKIRRDESEPTRNSTLGVGYQPTQTNTGDWRGPGAKPACPDEEDTAVFHGDEACLLYTSPSPRDLSTSRMPSSA